MTKIPQSNYTQVPNVFFDEILEGLNLAETKVLLAIMRKTFGWQKQIDRISYSQIVKMTGLSKVSISSGIKSLEKKDIIFVIRNGQECLYSVKVYSETGKEGLLVSNEESEREMFNRLSNFTGAGKEGLQVCDKTGKGSLHTKESILNKLDKETITQQPLIPSLSSKLITKETSNNNDSPFQTNTKKNKAKASTTSDSFLKPIEDRYFENYKILHSQKKLQLEKPPYSYAKNRAILSRYKSYDLDLINKVLDEAMNDKWVVDNGYSISHIFAESVFNRLANVKTKDDLMPVKNDCPVCGFPIQGNKCHFCGQGR
jgi:phage replication O-like protein O